MSRNTPKLFSPNQLQKDFFIADIFDNLPIKDDMASMGYPMFTLSKNKDLRTIRYEKNEVSILISPSFEYGLPTIFDKDVLLYCGSLLMEQVNQGNTPPKTLRISSHDLLIATNRVVNGNNYDLLEKALSRLAGVLIKTNIKTNGVEQVEGFHLIESFGFIKSSFLKDRRVALNITLSDWFYNSIVGKEVLTINPKYFCIGKALERRLYEIARKHCGSQKEWAVSLPVLHEKSGSTSPLKMFRFYMGEVAEKNDLPDYTIAMENDLVTFGNRAGQKWQGDLFTVHRISPETIKKGAVIVQEAGTGWDYDAIREQFTFQLIGGFQPKSVNGAFINFVKKKVANCP